jgi:hypothetical protein
MYMHSLHTHKLTHIYIHTHFFIFKLAITIDQVISINIAKKCYFIFFNTEHDLIQKLKIIKIKLYKSSPTYINFCSSFVCLINESSLGLFVSNFVHLGSISSHRVILKVQFVLILNPSKNDVTIKIII